MSKTANQSILHEKSMMAFAISGLVGLATAMTGCSLFFDNDRQTQDPFQYKEQGLSCVRSLGDDAKAYFNGEDRDPVQMVDCVTNALKKFSDNTRGARPDGWTRSELSSFFERVFKDEADKKSIKSKPSTAATDGDKDKKAKAQLKDSADSSETPTQPFDGNWEAQAQRRNVITEMFRWKSTLIGGSDQTLSRHELDRIRGLLMTAREPMTAWRGRGKYLAFREDLSQQNANPALVEELVQSLRTLGALIGRELDNEAHVPRAPMKIATLAASLEQAGVKVLDTPERMQLAETVKALMVGGSPQLVLGTDWKELITQGIELWSGALRVQYSIAKNPAAYNRDLDTVDTTISQLGQAIKRMVARHGGRIDNANLRELVLRLESNKLLPDWIKSRSLNPAFETIFGKLLAGNSNPNQSQLKLGLSEEHINRLLAIASDWLEGQKVVLEIATDGTEDSRQSIEQVRIRTSQVVTKGTTPSAEMARAQMAELILRGRALVHDSEGRLIILPQDLLPGVSRRDLQTLNISRSLLNVAMTAYAHEASRTGLVPKLTEAETQEMFSDLKSMGRDLGIVDIRSLTSGLRTFMEANIFLSVSDGDPFISLHEGVEWFETVMSAGDIADQIHQDLKPSCATDPLDVFGKPRIKAQCFRENILPILRRRMAHLPNVMRAITVVERSGQMPAFIRTMERAARPLGDSDLPIESSEIRTLSPELHYAEALFARFDANRSGLLDDPEVWSAYPLIRPFIQKLADGQNLSEKLQRGVFSWLLTHGEPPEQTTTGKIAFATYTYVKMPFVDETATVEDIVKILANFSQVGREKKNREVREYFKAFGARWERQLRRGDKPTLERTRDLMQCTSEADPDLTRLILARRSEIFAPLPANVQGGEEDVRAQAFVNRFKAMIQADPQLPLLCLPF